MKEGYKLCGDCNEEFTLDYFHKSKNGLHYRCCRMCYAAKFSKRLEENGGSSRMKNAVNEYTDFKQREQVFWFMELLGWTFTNGVWWKEGFKDANNVWTKFTETKQKRRRPNRVVIATKTNRVMECMDEIIKLKATGTSFEELADIYNVSHTTIRGVFRKYLDEKKNGLR